MNAIKNDSRKGHISALPEKSLKKFIVSLLVLLLTTTAAAWPDQFNSYIEIEVILPCNLNPGAPAPIVWSKGGEIQVLTEPNKAKLTVLVADGPEKVSGGFIIYDLQCRPLLTYRVYRGGGATLVVLEDF